MAHVQAWMNQLYGRQVSEAETLGTLYATKPRPMAGGVHAATDPSKLRKKRKKREAHLASMVKSGGSTKEDAALGVAKGTAESFTHDDAHALALSKLSARAKKNKVKMARRKAGKMGNDDAAAHGMSSRVSKGGKGAPHISTHVGGGSKDSHKLAMEADDEELEAELEDDAEEEEADDVETVGDGSAEADEDDDIESAIEDAEEDEGEEEAK